MQARLEGSPNQVIACYISNQIKDRSGNKIGLFVSSGREWRRFSIIINTDNQLLLKSTAFVSREVILMCLAIPARVCALLDSDRALIELDGLKREISIALVDEVAVGDYVIVHVGYALGKLDSEDAEQTLALLREFAKAQA